VDGPGRNGFVELLSIKGDAKGGLDTWAEGLCVPCEGVKEGAVRSYL
jgi:hypothetical protein